MPTITKPKHNSRYEHHGKDAEIKKLYNTVRWRKLRAAYLAEHPLCEDCLERDEVSQAVEIHHITPISTGITPEQMQILSYSWENLISLCADCHHRRHGKK